MMRVSMGFDSKKPDTDPKVNVSAFTGQRTAPPVFNKSKEVSKNSGQVQVYHYDGENPIYLSGFNRGVLISS
jgi:hypothetical protein